MCSVKCLISFLVGRCNFNNTRNGKNPVNVKLKFIPDNIKSINVDIIVRKTSRVNATNGDYNSVS
ncbi:hypothetical protein PIROE2DRAFT_13492 [Piromyces sp. E2]|nr:hypothetical protein PIROE2DRAFT_13492 [Piromyces sp. E2]|eukprot:OUM60675.1 hypothetical protein PIROE2DRAFT_13492 [Piromyces sp. E2]